MVGKVLATFAFCVVWLKTAAAQDLFIYPDVFNDPERDAFIYGHFPEDFKWSTATSSYQIEGAWNVPDKGMSIWDTWTHEPFRIANNDTGDVACDSYNNYEIDVQLIKAMGVKNYRFSLSWPRIMPDGLSPGVNGTRYYNDVIDELIENGINPQVTLYHWDLPQALENHGGFLNDSFVTWFENYARYCFETFGDRVKFWITFNEPWIIANLGYGGGGFAPGAQSENAIGTDVYVVAHNLIRAHAKAYRAYQYDFKAEQNGVIGITLNSDFVEPRDRNNPDDVEAADRNLQFSLGWWGHPIFINGDYPEIMKEKIARKSEAQGYETSRLPEFTSEEMDYIKGSSDFFGLNHYTSVYCMSADSEDNSNPPSYYKDSDTWTWKDDNWPSSGSSWLKVVPWGIRRLVKWISDEYNSEEYPIYVTENGISTKDVFELEDETRVNYYTAYINELLKAIEIDGVNVKGYTAWSLMDNFEWASGYTERFGLHYVNFSDPDRERIPKRSAEVYANIVAENGFPLYIWPDVFNNLERDSFYYGTFPEDFKWSTATSSYQIEGAWNVADKGESIWDKWTHQPDKIANGDTGDVACDSYNKYEVDVQLIKAMGVKNYRFSLSWPRLMPDGVNPSEDGLRYYNALIDDLLANGISPQVTLYHWDLPQALEDYGGFLSDDFPSQFENYADYCFQNFGDRVKFWITFNEPWIVANLGYGGGGFAPGAQSDNAIGTDVYVVAHNLIKAHARAYRKYESDYKTTQEGMVGITLNSDFVEPFDRSNPSDVEAQNRSLQFGLGWYAHPIFKNGDYPEVMKDKIARKSDAQGYEKSRLPEFTEEEMNDIRGSSDFFGLNHYTTSYCTDADSEDLSNPPSYYKDGDTPQWKDENWPATGSSWLQVVPWGIRRLVKWISDEYGSDVPIYVTENGVSTKDVFELNDEIRVKYYTSYINEVLKAIDLDGVNVKGYTAWSLMDNFEWAAGYTERFGLHYVDFSDPERPRTQKESARVYAKIVRNNGFPRVDAPTLPPVTETTEPPRTTAGGHKFGLQMLVVLFSACLVILFR